MGYDLLPIEKFGEQLVRSGDLDPVYIALRICEDRGVSREQTLRWLVAYWCLYHCGAACYISEAEGPAFWQHLFWAATQGSEAPIGEKGAEARWPRGHERRHFRGDAAGKAVVKMQVRFPEPEKLVETIYAVPPLYFKEVADRVQLLPQFGPWMAFKVADMLDRVLGIPVSFDRAAVFMFKDPAEAALMVWRNRMQLPKSAKPKTSEVKRVILESVTNSLILSFNHLTAPPLNDRSIGLQEVETILCKWKSHVNGHYPLNNDIVEITEGLKPWVKRSQMANVFLAAMEEMPYV